MDHFQTSPIIGRSHVLVLEDDHGVRRSLQLLLRGRGFAVKAYASAPALLSDAAVLHAVCLVTDYRLADTDGIAVFQELQARGWRMPAVLMTAFGSDEVAARARDAGFAHVFEKPLKDLALVAALERLTT